MLFVPLSTDEGFAEPDNTNITDLTKATVDDINAGKKYPRAVSSTLGAISASSSSPASLSPATATATSTYPRTIRTMRSTATRRTASGAGTTCARSMLFPSPLWISSN